MKKTKILYTCVTEDGEGYRWAFDPRLTGEIVPEAGSEDRNTQDTGKMSAEGLAARPFPFRVVYEYLDWNDPPWNSCHGKDGCSNAGSFMQKLSGGQWVVWLLEDELD